MKNEPAGPQPITATREPQSRRPPDRNNDAPLPATLREGVGLATTRERLAARYGVAASLTLRAAEAGGVETVIELPA